VALVSDRYWVHTRSGAKGDELIGVTHFEIGIPFGKNVGFLANYGSYDRSARYAAYGTRSEMTQEIQIRASYTFD
jgi:hypothetical protein